MKPDRLLKDVLRLRSLEVQRFYVAVEAKSASGSQHIMRGDTIIEVKDVCAGLSTKRKNAGKRSRDMEPAR